MRLYRQLCKLWMGLDILNVKDKRKIILEIVQGCGNKVRKAILGILYQKVYGKNSDIIEINKKTVQELASLINVDKREVLAQLMILRSLNCVHCKGKDEDKYNFSNNNSVWEALPEQLWGEEEEE